ncbi:MAG: 1-acyl-sn-glycerol-3-phosphate acyltransferase [Deltaproteobacteria bacterium]|nr:1-acyl-sn-glycerol-3-phosphate acyltransferase [Deltaproteobacteria bacterium]
MTEPDGALTRAVRSLCLGLVRLFYREIAVSGLHHLPATGAVLLVANHPNGLLDPVVLRLAVGRPVGFLAKSTLFGNPVGRLALNAFAGLPVFRPRDGADTSHNERTFALARQRMEHGCWIALFPEGTSHSDPTMRPLRTGAARLALSYVEAQPADRLHLVPCGLLYQAKETFRSRVAVQIGEPLDVSAFAARHGCGFDAARQLTEDVQGDLSQVVLQADQQTLLRGLVAVAGWVHKGAARDLAAQQALAQRLAHAWQILLAADPDRAHGLQTQAAAFAAELADLGIDDPWQIDEPLPAPGAVLRGTLGLLWMCPFAVIGAVLGWPAYRAIRPLSVVLAGTETDLIGTIKVLLGLVGMPAWWGAQAWVAAAVGGWRAALVVAVAGPLSGWLALRWSERWQRRRQVLRLAWLRGVRNEVAAEVRRHRDELSRAVLAALEG